MSEPTCQTCRFYINHGQAEDCRRHAPIAVHEPGLGFGVTQMAFPARWPQVRFYNTCGDHKPKTNSPERQS